VTAVFWSVGGPSFLPDTGLLVGWAGRGVMHFGFVVMTVLLAPACDLACQSLDEGRHVVEQTH